MPRTNVILEDGYHTTISARQHLWRSDATIEDEGQDLAPVPEEMLLGALGSCMAITGQMYARRKGWKVDRIRVDLDIERFNAVDYPAYQGENSFVHEISEHIVIEGDLTDEQRERIRQIMGKCPVRRVLANPVFFVEPEK